MIIKTHNKKFKADVAVKPVCGLNASYADKPQARPFLGRKMEIRELTKNDLPSLLELYIQLSENNKNISLEKSKEIWIKQMYNLKFSIQSFTFIKN